MNLGNVVERLVHDVSVRNGVLEHGDRAWGSLRGARRDHNGAVGGMEARSADTCLLYTSDAADE